MACCKTDQQWNPVHLNLIHILESKTQPPSSQVAELLMLNMIKDMTALLELNVTTPSKASIQGVTTLNPAIPQTVCVLDLHAGSYIASRHCP
jgi:hypothetical protein